MHIRRANNMKKYNVSNRLPRSYTKSSNTSLPPVFPAKNTDLIDCKQVSDRSGIQYDNDIVEKNKNSLDIIDIDSSLTKKVLNDGMKLKTPPKINRRRSISRPVTTKVRENILCPLVEENNQKNYSTLQVLANEMMKGNKNSTTVPVQIKVDDQDWTVNVSKTVVSQSKSTAEFPKNRDDLFKALKEESYKLLKLVSKKNSVRNDVRMVFDPKESRVTPFHINFKAGDNTVEETVNDDNLDMTKFLSSDAEYSDEEDTLSDESINNVEEVNINGSNRVSGKMSINNLPSSSDKGDVVDKVLDQNNASSEIEIVNEENISIMQQNLVEDLPQIATKHTDSSAIEESNKEDYNNGEITSDCSYPEDDDEIKTEINQNVQYEYPIVNDILGVSDEHENIIVKEESNQHIVCISDIDQNTIEVTIIESVKKEIDQNNYIEKTMDQPIKNNVLQMDITQNGNENEDIILESVENVTSTTNLETEYIIPEIDFMDNTNFKCSADRINVADSFPGSSVHSSHNFIQGTNENIENFSEVEESEEHSNSLSQNVGRVEFITVLESNEEVVMLNNDLPSSSYCLNSDNTASGQSFEMERDPLCMDGFSGGALFYDPETDYDNSDTLHFTANSETGEVDFAQPDTIHCLENSVNSDHSVGKESSDESINDFNLSDRWNRSTLKKYNSKVSKSSSMKTRSSQRLSQESNINDTEEEKFLGFTDCSISLTEYHNFVSACSKLGYYDDMIVFNQHYEVSQPFMPVKNTYSYECRSEMAQSKRGIPNDSPSTSNYKSNEEQEEIFFGFESNDQYSKLRRRSIEISRRLSEEFDCKNRSLDSSFSTSGYSKSANDSDENICDALEWNHTSLMPDEIPPGKHTNAAPKRKPGRPGKARSGSKDKFKQKFSDGVSFIQNSKSLNHEIDDRNFALGQSSLISEEMNKSGQPKRKPGRPRRMSLKSAPTNDDDGIEPKGKTLNCDFTDQVVFTSNNISDKIILEEEAKRTTVPSKQENFTKQLLLSKEVNAFTKVINNAYIGKVAETNGMIDTLVTEINGKQDKNLSPKNNLFILSVNENNPIKTYNFTSSSHSDGSTAESSLNKEANVENACINLINNEYFFKTEESDTETKENQDEKVPTDDQSVKSSVDENNLIEMFHLSLEKKSSDSDCSIAESFSKAEESATERYGKQDDKIPTGDQLNLSTNINNSNETFNLSVEKSSSASDGSIVESLFKTEESASEKKGKQDEKVPTDDQSVKSSEDENNSIEMFELSLEKTSSDSDCSIVESLSKTEESTTERKGKEDEKVPTYDQSVKSSVDENNLIEMFHLSLEKKSSNSDCSIAESFSKAEESASERYGKQDDKIPTGDQLKLSTNENNSNETFNLSLEKTYSVSDGCIVESLSKIEESATEKKGNQDEKIPTDDQSIKSSEDENNSIEMFELSLEKTSSDSDCSIVESLSKTEESATEKKGNQDEKVPTDDHSMKSSEDENNSIEMFELSLEKTSSDSDCSIVESLSKTEESATERYGKQDDKIPTDDQLKLATNENNSNVTFNLSLEKTYSLSDGSIVESLSKIEESATENKGNQDEKVPTDDHSIKSSEDENNSIEMFELSLEKTSSDSDCSIVESLLTKKADVEYTCINRINNESSSKVVESATQGKEKETEKISTNSQFVNLPVNENNSMEIFNLSLEKTSNSDGSIVESLIKPEETSDDSDHDFSLCKSAIEVFSDTSMEAVNNTCEENIDIRANIVLEHKTEKLLLNGNHDTMLKKDLSSISSKDSSSSLEEFSSEAANIGGRFSEKHSCNILHSDNNLVISPIQNKISVLNTKIQNNYFQSSNSVGNVMMHDMESKSDDTPSQYSSKRGLKRRIARAIKESSKRISLGNERVNLGPKHEDGHKLITKMKALDYKENQEDVQIFINNKDELFCEENENLAQPSLIAEAERLQSICIKDVNRENKIDKISFSHSKKKEDKPLNTKFIDDKNNGIDKGNNVLKQHLTEEKMIKSPEKNCKSAFISKSGSVMKVVSSSEVLLKSSKSQEKVEKSYITSVNSITVMEESICEGNKIPVQTSPTSEKIIQSPLEALELIPRRKSSLTSKVGGDFEMGFLEVTSAEDELPSNNVSDKKELIYQTSDISGKVSSEQVNCLQLTPKKKPGRPRKSSLIIESIDISGETPEEFSQPALKRKPGRPRKWSLEPQAKRGCSRPRRSLTPNRVNELTDNIYLHEEKKKHEDLSSNGLSDNEFISEGNEITGQTSLTSEGMIKSTLECIQLKPKRKPGRPRKSSLTPQGVGKSTDEISLCEVKREDEDNESICETADISGVTLSTALDCTQPVLKRRPGRPRKSSLTHNKGAEKSTDEISLLEIKGEDEENESVNETANISCDALSNLEACSPPVVKRSGRPRKMSLSPNEVGGKSTDEICLLEIKREDDNESIYKTADISGITLSAAVDCIQPVLKRRPGRPRKSSLTPNKGGGKSTDEICLEVKKKEEDESICEITGISSEVSPTAEACSQPKVKRRPGRPRKSSLEPSAKRGRDCFGASVTSTPISSQALNDSDVDKSQIENSNLMTTSHRRSCREKSLIDLENDNFIDVSLIDESTPSEPKKRRGRKKGFKLKRNIKRLDDIETLEPCYIIYNRDTGTQIQRGIPKQQFIYHDGNNVTSAEGNSTIVISDDDDDDCDLSSKQKARLTKRRLLSGRVDSLTKLKYPDDQVKCAVCGEMMNVKDYQQNHLLKHNFIAWLEGEEPLPVDDIDYMNTVLIRGKRAHPKIIFKCEACNLEKKSAKGLLSHRLFCGKTEQEKESMMEYCVYCGRVMMPASIPAHVYQCHRTQSETTSEEPTTPMRKAASKCLGKIASYAEDEDLQDPSMSRNVEDFQADVDGDEEFDEIEEISLLYIPIQKQKANKQLVRRWKQCVAENKEICCPFPTCKFTTLLFDDIQQHHKTCTSGVCQGYSCIKCNYICKVEEEMREHVRTCNPPIMVSHSDNSEDDEQCEKNVVIPYLRKAELTVVHHRYKCQFFKPALRWTKQIYDMYLSSEPLFHDLALNINSWEEMDTHSSQFYNPETSQSMRICYQNSKWESMHTMEGKVLEGNQGLGYAGGPIWGLEWCPGDGDQYLALSTHLTMESNFQVGSTANGPGLVQLWSVEDINNSKDGCLSTLQFSYGLCHNERACWNMAWCPSGGRTDTRIGLLALATTSGSIPIYAMPKPQCLLPLSSRFYKPDPVIRLELWSNERWQCSAISWSKIKPHSIIAAGFVNGIIAVWDLSSKSKLLRKKLILHPFKVFQAHNSIVTGVCLSPERDTYLASASYDKSFKYWDLNDTTAPQSILKRGLFTSVDWLRHWMSAVTTYDNAYTMLQTSVSLTSIRGFVCPTMQVITNINSTSWSVSVNDWLNGAITSYDNGQVVLFLALKQAAYQHMDKRKYSKVILQTTLHSFEKPSTSSENETASNQKVDELHKNNIPSNSYSEAIERYGLSIKTDFEIGRADKIQEKSPENMNDIYPLSSINRVAWNSNRQSFLYVAMGYQSGFLVVAKLSVPRVDQTAIDEISQS